MYVYKKRKIVNFIPEEREGYLGKDSKDSDREGV